MQKRSDYEDFQARAALYALGVLPQLEAQALTDELTVAPDEIRAEVAEMQEVVAQFGLSVDEAAPSADLRARLLTRIANEPQHTKTVAPSDTPAHVPAHLDVLAHEGHWNPLFDGVACKILFTESTNGYVTSLLKLDPNARLPNHKHKGAEQCLVVGGEFRMNGKLYRPGDFTVALDGSEHLDIHTETGGLLLLVSPPDYELIAR
ncbi:MAG TPA: cupin domain-containing protein [Blastocatellia bacterium]|nr:cupin domain-containing protein [Blastocatellia bacterium]